MYKITSNGYYFGLELQGKEALPCNNNRIFRLTEDLVGFRQGDRCGLFSLGTGTVVHEPTILAALPYYKRISCIEGKPLRPIVQSEHGEFVKHKIYLERCEYLLWRKDRLRLVADGKLVIIHRKRGLIDISFAKTIVAMSLEFVQECCLYEDEYGMPTIARNQQFQYKSKKDMQLDEMMYLEKADDLFSELEFDTTEGDEQDDDLGIAEYKVYDYDAIPAAIKGRFQAHINELSGNKAADWVVRVLIFMAWCHANRYVTYTRKGKMQIDPYYKLPPEDAEHVIDATGLYEMHQLLDLEHLLYVSPVTGTYYEVLICEN